MKNVPAVASRTLRPFLSEDPFQALQREMENLFSQFQTSWNGTPAGMTPALDITETDDAVQVRLDLPGMKTDDIDIEVSGNLLRVSGERKEDKEEKEQTYHRMERRYGSFLRAISLPCAIQENQVDAEFRDGVLTIRLPKTEEAKSRKIQIRS